MTVVNVLNRNNDQELRELGQLVRQRREEMGYGLRGVARLSQISPAYLIALEQGVNPKTGRPSRPSKDILSRLDDVLSLGNRAYGLAQYDGVSRNERIPHSYRNRAESEWISLIDVYIAGIKKDFLSIDEGQRGEMLGKISRIAEEYTSHSLDTGADMPDRIKFLKNLETRLNSIEDCIRRHDDLKLYECIAYLQGVSDAADLLQTHTAIFYGQSPRVEELRGYVERGEWDRVLEVCNRLLGVAEGSVYALGFPLISRGVPNIIMGVPQNQSVPEDVRAKLDAFPSGGYPDTPVKLVRAFPGLTKENLYYWERKGYIHPTKVTRGRKIGRVYDRTEALRVGLILGYIHIGLSLPTAAMESSRQIDTASESG